MTRIALVAHDAKKDDMVAWARRHHNRITISDATIASRYGTEAQRGIRIGYWDEDDLKGG